MFLSPNSKNYSENNRNKRFPSRCNSTPHEFKPYFSQKQNVYLEPEMLNTNINSDLSADDISLLEEYKNTIDDPFFLNLSNISDKQKELNNKTIDSMNKFNNLFSETPILISSLINSTKEFPNCDLKRSDLIIYNKFLNFDSKNLTSSNSFIYKTNNE